MTAEILERVYLPTAHGDFEMIAFDSGVPDFPHLALITKGLDASKPVLSRVHSECLTGDLFGSARCDCGEQLAESLTKISEEGGALLYLRQEGRGIGLINKMKAYNFQDTGMNTIEANHALGFGTDEREFDVAIAIYKRLKIHQVRLLTNNPEKVDVFKGTEVELVERVPLIIKSHAGNEGYLKVKKEQMGHFFGEL